MADPTQAPQGRSQTSPETAWPVRKLNEKIGQWIDQLGWLWVEGQLTQISAKPSWKNSYLTLRDTEEDRSVELICATAMLAQQEPPLKSGDRIVVFARPEFSRYRGKLAMRVTEFRHVGIGELLARIEALRVSLQAEGLFDASRKRPLPYLPNRVGLITGRESHAERDVIEVATTRWPSVQFEIINTAVQGPRAVPEIVEALRSLDQNPHVDVIIIARGGGSVEDLLPFSEETLQRAVAAVNTPVISAIGHEPDTPLLDYVADVRAATPTDAAKRVVPDVAEQRALIAELRSRMGAALRGWVHRERQGLEAVRSRPVMAQPMLVIDQQREIIDQAKAQMRTHIKYLLGGEQSTISGLRRQVAALGPSATLARGYAVVQVLPRDRREPEVLTQIVQSPPGSQLRIRVADGSVTAAAMSTTPSN